MSRRTHDKVGEAVYRPQLRERGDRVAESGSRSLAGPVRTARGRARAAALVQVIAPVRPAAPGAPTSMVLEPVLIDVADSRRRKTEQDGPDRRGRVRQVAEGGLWRRLGDRSRAESPEPEPHRDAGGDQPAEPRAPDPVSAAGTRRRWSGVRRNVDPKTAREPVPSRLPSPPQLRIRRQDAVEDVSERLRRSGRRSRARRSSPRRVCRRVGEARGVGWQTLR